MKLIKDKVPLYYQLENILRRRILSQELSSSSPFPTDYQLCEEFGVSRITVRQALKILEDDGLIKREQGRGTFILPVIQKTSFFEMSGSLEKIFDFREATIIKLISKKRVKADEIIANDLGVDFTSDIFVFEGRQQALLNKTKHVQFIQVYTHLNIGKNIQPGEMESSIFLVVLEKAALEKAVQYNQIIYALAADKKLSKTMNVSVGSPLLVNKNIFISKNQKVLGIVIRYSPGDAYQIVHKMKLKKRGK